MSKKISSAEMRRKPRQARSQARVDRILTAAETLFLEQGYEATTTNEIAARAEVAIGSLYQFFSGKSAIVQALAERYMAILEAKFHALHQNDIERISISDYVDRIIAATAQFFEECPGYHAIFTQVQGIVPELSAIESAADNRLIQDWATILAATFSGLDEEDYHAISYVLVKAIGTLLWLSPTCEHPFQQRLIAETKRLMLSYLESYFPAIATES